MLDNCFQKSRKARETSIFGSFDIQTVYKQTEYVAI